MKKILVILSFLSVVSFSSMAQCDTIANFCHKNNFTVKYISDGQNYRAFLSGEQEAEFEATFFEGTNYRIAACTGFNQGGLIFKLKDELGNVLYDSQDFSTAPHWDFKFKNTVTLKVVANLDPLEAKSGCAAILIGFKK